MLPFIKQESLYTSPPCRRHHALLKASLFDLQVGAQVLKQEAHTEVPVGLWLTYECTAQQLATLSGSEIRPDRVSEHKKSGFQQKSSLRARRGSLGF